MVITGTQNVQAQCNNLSSYGSAVAPAAGITTTITTCQYASEYATITGAVAGNSYTSTSSVSTDWITVRQGSPGGPVRAFGPTPLTWSAAVAGNYYIHYNTNSACGTLNTCRTSTIIGRGTGCTNTTAYTTGAATTSATLVTVSSCIYAQEYHTMTGATAGATYQVVSSIATDWITVRQGTYNGPLIAAGTGTINFTTLVAGNYYIHVNTNSACGLSATCRNLSMARLFVPAAGGCTNTSMYPGAFTAPAVGVTYTISTCQFQSEYNQMNSVVAGHNFISTASIAGTYITIRYGTYNGAVVAQGTTPLTWAATAGAGSYFIHYNTNAACGTATTCMTSTIQNVLAGCTNTSQYPSPFAAPAAGVTYTISTCQFQSEYNQMTGVVSGHTFISTASIAGTYITVRYGTYNGAVVAAGTTPLSWTATAGAGTYFIHYNTNASCGTATTCMTSTIQNTTPAPYDPCASITNIASCGVSTVATIASGTGAWALGIYTPPGKEKIYTFTPTTTGNYTITQSGNTGGSYIDYFYKAAAGGCNNTGWTFLQDLFGAPVTSVATMSLTAGVQYYIMLDPEYTTGTTVTFSINCVCTPPLGDVFANPIVIGALPYSTTGNNLTSNCWTNNIGQTSPDVYYRVIPTCNGSLNMNMCGGGTMTDTYLHILNAAGTILTSNDDNGPSCAGLLSSINYTVTAGTTYYVVCEGFSANEGTYSLSVSLTPTYVTWYADADGDSYGDPGVSLSVCDGTTPGGYVSNSTDCNDANASINPAASEICNGVDEDCDGTADDGLIFTTYYADADGDGFGDAGATATTCDGAPAGYITDNTDCDDTQITYADIDGDGFGSGSPVACGVANNSDCYPLDITYADGDGDGFGSDVLAPCGVSNSDDCDDAQLLYTDLEGDGFGSGSPVACGVANNSDCYPLDYTYNDGDGDGYGAGAATPCGNALNDTDCNDGASSIYPGATEMCNGVDDDCDGTADDGLTFLDYYVDADGDGYGDAGATAVNSCAPVAGSVADNTDCNDANASINPGISEICNGVDDDCDFVADDGLAFLDYYTDGDGDGYGDAGATAVNSCAPVAGSVADNTDCNDANASINPGASEICNGVDEDCDFVADDGLTFLDYYTDADGDGYGDAGATAMNSCAPVAGSVTNNTDCNDANASINPGASEICNGVDDDCDGSADDGLPFTTYYADADGDGFGDAGSTTSTCDGTPAGYVTDNTDCNDALVTYVDIDGDGFGSGSPVACGVGNNSDCYPLDITYADGDGDGFGGDVLAPCGVINSDDCDDAMLLYVDIDGDGFGSGSPAACGVANNSDCWPLDITYTDGDGDGYGAGAPSACGSSLNNTDCDDLIATTYPGAPELCNAVDDDCDGSADEGLVFTTWYADADADLYGDAGVSTSTCDGAPTGYVADNTDCDDTQSTVYPGATEICDGLDNDCDGDTDEATATATITPTGTITICKNDPETLFANTGVGYVYQWFKNGNLIPGATDATFAPSKPGYYQVQVNIPEGCFALSDVTTINAYPNPNANIYAPNGTSLCASVKLKASYEATYTWQWNIEGAPIPGATTYLYFPTTPGNYSCTISNTYGCVRTTEVMTVTACKGAETEIVAEEVFELYPNPTDQVVTLEMEIDSELQEGVLVIANLTGEEVYSGTLAVENGTIYTVIQLDDAIPSGMYLVRVQVGDKLYTKQLVIQK